MPSFDDQSLDGEGVETSRRPPLPRVELEITRGTARRRRRRVVGRTYLIGAAADCDMVLADARFPVVHAYLLRDVRGAKVRWLGHGPELTVNGRLAVGSVRLHDGDRIRTGAYELRIHVDASVAEPPRVEAPPESLPQFDRRPITLARRAAPPGAPALAQDSVPLRLYIEPESEPSGPHFTPKPAPAAPADRHRLVWLELEHGPRGSDPPAADDDEKSAP